MHAAPITIKRVSLINFLSHRQTDISFDNGVTVIVGENGAGKTSILEAIFFALTGNGWRGRRGERTYLINVSASEAVVRLWLDVGGEELYVERVVSRRGRSSATLRFGRERVVGDQAVTSRIREILGLGAEALGSVAIVGQGSITRLFGSLKSSERKSLIDKLLELDTYKQAWERLKDYPFDAGGRVLSAIEVLPKDPSIRKAKSRVADELAKVREREEELRSKEEEIKVLEEQVSELNDRIRELRSRREEIEGRIKELERVEEEYHRLESLRDKLRKDLSRLRSEELRIKGEVESIKHEIIKLEDLAAKAEYEELVNRLTELMAEEERIQEELQYLMRELSDVRKAEERLKEIRSRYGDSLDSVEEELSRVEDELQRINERRERIAEELGKVRSALESISEKIIEYEGRLKEFLREAASHLMIRSAHGELSLDRVVKALNELESRLRRDEEEVKARYDELRRLEGELRAREALSNEKAALLLKGGVGGGKCPLCGSPLSRERAERIKESLINEARRAAEERRRVKEELRGVEQLMNKIGAKLELINELKYRLEEARKVEGELSSLEDKKRNLELIINELERERESVSNEASRLERRRELLKSIVKDLEWIRKSLEGRPSLKELELRVDELRGRLDIVRKELSMLRNQLSKAFNLDKGINEVRDEVRRAKEARGRLAELRGRLSELSSRLEELRQQVSVTEEELRSVEGRINELKPVIEELRSLRSEREEVINSLSKLERSHGMLSERLKGLKSEAEKIREWLGKAREDIREYREAIFNASILLWLRENILSPDGAPKLLRQAALRSIEALMRKYLELFNTSYTDVRIDDDLNVYFASPSMPGTWVEFSRLSGGEKVIASLSALLALHNVVSKGRLGFLILDEPTEYLDDERRKQLIEVLKGFRGGNIMSQLIIVTHDEEVKEAADAVYEVVKDTYSRVEEVDVTP